MALTEIQDTYSWQTAIELGPHLVRLAEELPAAEQWGLAQQLRQGMVELPAAIALDLTEGGNTRRPVMLRLVATLDLIDTVYPALDTARSHAMLTKVVERITSDRFSERMTAPEPAEPAAGEPDQPEPESVTPAASQGAAPEVPAAPVGSPVAVIPPTGDPAATPLMPPSEPANQEAVTIHVQPNSGQ